jgi:precorrin-6A/cobalt-precorrin-6A reductase
LILDRGPFTEQGERDLLQEHRIEALVTRNSGGDETSPKIVAARTLGLPVIMIDRPTPPAGEMVSTPAEALAWLQCQAVRAH